MALHAFAYCERLFYLEEVEEIRLADHRVFAGRTLHERLEDDETEGESISLELGSDRLGLIGKVDCLKRRDGSYLPYEHKRGRPAPIAESTNSDADAARWKPWPSDRLQVIAYAVMIEDAFGQEVPEGRIRYHAVNVTLRVAIDDQAKADLADALKKIRLLRESVERPPVTDNPALCEKCSLAPVCLPEEVRFDHDSNHDPKRLFPPDRDGATLHVIAQGTFVGVRSDSIVLKSKDGSVNEKPARNVDSILVHGFNQISTQAIRKCAEHGIGVHWLTTSGYHTASIVPHAGQVQRRIRQYQALQDQSFCLRLAGKLARSKIQSQYRYLLRASRENSDLRERVVPSLRGIVTILSRARHAADRDSLRGLEGSAAVQYFEGLRHLLGEKVHDDLRFVNRSRRPPLDRFNALLSYGYGLLHTAVMRAVLATGLEPAFGFFHTPRSAAYPLVLDLMELFRVAIWDIPLIGSLNRGHWDPVTDFAVTKSKVWLSEDGRRKAIEIFERRLQENWKHPVLGSSLSYVRTIELEARLLEKEWTGEPGLFARSRLR